MAVFPDVFLTVNKKPPYISMQETILKIPFLSDINAVSPSKNITTC